MPVEFSPSLSQSTLVLSLVLATIYAGVFYSVKGTALIELPMFWAAAFVGFIVGELAAQILGADFLLVGELHLVEASIVSVACLLIARWLKV